MNFLIKFFLPCFNDDREMKIYWIFWQNLQRCRLYKWILWKCECVCHHKRNLSKLWTRMTQVFMLFDYKQNLILIKIQIWFQDIFFCARLQINHKKKNRALTIKYLRLNIFRTLCSKFIKKYHEQRYQKPHKNFYIK